MENSVPENSGFVKTTEDSAKALNPAQKALLNRRGNEFFNEGNIEAAKRIFMTTGYSDGLSRVGDMYARENKHLEALRMYWLARNRRKFEPLIENLRAVVSAVLANDRSPRV